MQKALLPKSQLYELPYRDRLVMFPENKNIVRFSAIRTDDSGEETESFTNEDKIQLRTDALELDTSVVFFERFFNQTPFSELADRLGIPVEVVRRRWRAALEKVETLSAVLDRKNGAERNLDRNKNSYRKQFTDEEKAFLMVTVFDFTSKEVAEILGKRTAGGWSKRLRKMKDKYRAAFDSVES